MRKIVVILVISLLVVFSGCSREGSREETDSTESTSAYDSSYQQMTAAVSELSVSSEQMKLLREFLEKYPEGAQTVDTLEWLNYLLGEEGEAKDAIIEFAKTTRARIKGSEIGLAVDLFLCHKYSETGQLENFTSLATSLGASAQVSFNDLVALCEAAIELSAWDLVTVFSLQAEPAATAAQYRDDYSDRTFTEEEVVVAGANREAMIKSFAGWAKVNTDRISEGLADFAEATTRIRRDRLGHTTSVPLDYYHGRALMMNGEMESAAAYIAKAATHLDQKDAWGTLREIYETGGGDPDGFLEYAVATISAEAPMLPEFNLPGYDDKMHTLSEMAGKATLLLFWFPT